jgi:hypothetical protein
MAIIKYFGALARHRSIIIFHFILKMNEIPQLEEETLSIITLIHLLDVRALFNRENERMITIDYKTFSRSPEKKGECIGGEDKVQFQSVTSVHQNFCLSHILCWLLLCVIVYLTGVELWARRHLSVKLQTRRRKMYNRHHDHGRPSCLNNVISAAHTQCVRIG